MSKEHPQASIYDADELKRLVSLTVDIVLHVTAEKVYDEQGEPLRKERYVTEVMFDPIAKLQARFGAARVYVGGG
jgi:type IV secretion system protein VirB11